MVQEEEPGATDSATPSGSQTSDGSLLRRIHRGGSDAATLLYFRYADHLCALVARQLANDLAGRLDPEDIVQSVFRTFFRRASQGHYDVPAGQDLWKLFLVIALNKIRRAGNHHRAARRDVSRTTRQDESQPALTDPHPQQDTALTTLQMVIEELLHGQPPNYRSIIERRIEGYEVAEIAALVSRSKRSVERVLRSFREQLQRTLNEE
jgi:RNA polymerase sigma-70 factor (ECF subfamily)